MTADRNSKRTAEPSSAEGQQETWLLYLRIAVLAVLLGVLVFDLLRAFGVITLELSLRYVVFRTAGFRAGIVLLYVFPSLIVHSVALLRRQGWRFVLWNAPSPPALLMLVPFWMLLACYPGMKMEGWGIFELSVSEVGWLNHFERAYDIGYFAYTIPVLYVLLLGELVVASDFYFGAPGIRERLHRWYKSAIAVKGALAVRVALGAVLVAVAVADVRLATVAYEPVRWLGIENQFALRLTLLVLVVVAGVSTFFIYRKDALDHPDKILTLRLSWPGIASLILVATLTLLTFLGTALVWAWLQSAMAYEPLEVHIINLSHNILLSVVAVQGVNLLIAAELLILIPYYRIEAMRAE